MSNAKYISGRSLEYKVVNWFKEMGALHANRTAGSHGPFDVVGSFSWGTAYAQCKRGGGPTAKDWEAIRLFAKFCPTPICMVHAPKRGEWTITWVNPAPAGGVKA